MISAMRPAIFAAEPRRCEKGVMGMSSIPCISTRPSTPFSPSSRRNMPRRTVSSACDLTEPALDVSALSLSRRSRRLAPPYCAPAPAPSASSRLASRQAKKARTDHRIAELIVLPSRIHSQKYSRYAVFYRSNDTKLSGEVPHQPPTAASRTKNGVDWAPSATRAAGALLPHVLSRILSHAGNATTCPAT